MVKKLEQPDFSQDAFGIHQIIKGIFYFLDSYFYFCLFVKSGADDAVCAMRNMFDKFVFFIHVECGA
jgi:hypothetical protein